MTSSYFKNSTNRLNSRLAIFLREREGTRKGFYLDCNIERERHRKYERHGE